MSQIKGKEDFPEDCLNALADFFSFDIIYYKGSKVIKSNHKERVFASPLVIFSNEKNAYVIYTREEANLFAKGIEAKDNETNEEVEKLLQKVKTMEDSLNKKKKEVEDYKEACDEFISKTINFVKAVKDHNTTSLDKEKDNLINAKVFSGRLNTEACSDFADNLSTQKKNLKKVIEALEDKLSEDEEHKGPKKEICYVCRTSCDFYNGIKLKCKHTLDQICLQEYS